MDMSMTGTPTTLPLEPACSLMDALLWKLIVKLVSVESPDVSGELSKSSNQPNNKQSINQQILQPEYGQALLQFNKVAY